MTSGKNFKIFSNSFHKKDDLLQSKIRAKKVKAGINLRHTGWLRCLLIPLSIIIVRDLLNEKGIIRKLGRMMSKRGS